MIATTRVSLSLHELFSFLFFFHPSIYLHRYYLAVAVVDNLELVERVEFLALVEVGRLVAAAAVEWAFQEREPTLEILGKMYSFQFNN